MPLLTLSFSASPPSDYSSSNYNYRSINYDISGDELDHILLTSVVSTPIVVVFRSLLQPPPSDMDLPLLLDFRTILSALSFHQVDR